MSGHEAIWLDRVGATIAAGGALDESDIATLGRERNLLLLGMLAEEVRRQRHGARATFVRVAEAPMDRLPPAVPPAARELRLVGRPTSIDAACDAVSAACGVAGGVPVTGFSLADLDDLAGGTERRLAEDLDRLREAGLALIAEAPVDRLRDPRPLETAARAGLRIARLTVDNPPDGDPLTWVRHVAAWGTLAGVAHAFAPLARRFDSSAPSTGYDDVRLVALARLLVREVASIQVDWSLYGPKLAQVALTFGADDLDNVSPIDALTLGPRRSAAAEVRRYIEAAALEPVERDGAFRAVSP